MNFLGDWYLWIKALHVIAIIAWMAGLLYLPRLFVYHCQVEAGSAQSELFKVMERRLFRAIMNPSMIAAWIFGLLLMADIGAWSDPWFHAKALGIIGLTFMHHLMGRWRKAFERDENQKSQRYFRMMNEVPTVLMIVVVIMVIVKPF
jgi:putative membrane protein